MTPVHLVAQGATRAYALGSLTLLAAPFTPMVAWWPLQLGAIFAPWLCLPIPALAAFAVGRRDWLSLLCLAAPLVSLLVQYVPSFAPPAAPAPGAPLRVMTANLKWVNANAEAFHAVLLKEQPDVVIVQELGMAMSSRLGSRLKDVYPYQHPFARDNWLGMGVFSRYPVRSITPPENGPLGCFCQQAEIELDSRVVTLVNVHPRPPSLEGRTLWRTRLPLVFTTASQEPALRAMLERIDRAASPLIVAGDFNTSDRQPYYARVRERLQDAFREGGRGFGFTFPAAQVGFSVAFPVVRIDYIFHDQAWTTRAAWTGSLEGSDHRYVVADLVLR